MMLSCWFRRAISGGGGAVRLSLSLHPYTTPRLHILPLRRLISSSSSTSSGSSTSTSSGGGGSGSRSSGSSSWQRSSRNRDSMFYVISIGVVAVGVTFAAIPAYRMFCEQTSFGGLTQIAKDVQRIATMERVEDRLIRVQFNADIPSSMRWSFKPLQHEIYVHPGETALAFYTAYNPTDRPIIGISTYNLTPFQAAYYFNKIQCFCFEEQILNPGERVDLPVFFYIDPDYANDPALEYLDSILLSYTFFEAKSDLVLPSPFDPTNRPSVKDFTESKTKTRSRTTATETTGTSETPNKSSPEESESAKKTKSIPRTPQASITKGEA